MAFCVAGKEISQKRSEITKKHFHPNKCCLAILGMENRQKLALLWGTHGTQELSPAVASG